MCAGRARAAGVWRDLPAFREFAGKGRRSPGMTACKWTVVAIAIGEGVSPSPVSILQIDM
ncbi:MAG: hypothetical protein CVV31_00360 [Methanomicrobiales archaeon HGW-Methanomicrobiales-2]|nr:MAG: hypothetical protein CVV31_00360 [Methanomicrobiales archaeon HGW-Methanomicrobiales-2]